jgi:hypothetical protein
MGIASSGGALVEHRARKTAGYCAMKRFQRWNVRARRRFLSQALRFGDARDHHARAQ